MGLFFGNYNKPGPGVSKDAPKKRRFFLYWDMLIEKWRKIFQLNLIFAAFSVAPVVLAILVYVFSKSFLVAGILLIPVYIPICGLCRCAKKLACDEPIFAFSDFWEAVKENYKQALVLGAIDYALIVFFVVMFKLYVENMGENILFAVCFVVSCILALYFMFMQSYLPLFTVTFRLSIPDIIKNSLIFSLVNIKSNFLITLLTSIFGFLIALSFELVDTPILSGVSIVVMVVALFSFLSFTANFAVWPKVNELLIAPYENEEEEQEDEDTNDVENDITFSTGPVFKDGKLVIPEEDEDE